MTPLVPKNAVEMMDVNLSRATKFDEAASMKLSPVSTEATSEHVGLPFQHQHQFPKKEPTLGKQKRARPNVKNKSRPQPKKKKLSRNNNWMVRKSLCSDNSTDHNKHDNGITIMCHKTKGGALRCSQCSCPTCVTFTKRCSAKIPKGSNTGDQQCKDTAAFLQGEKPGNFICSGCEWRIETAQIKKDEAGLACLPRRHDDGGMAFIV